MEILPTDAQYYNKLKVLDALYNVMDPELFVNIIDLGLVYAIAFDEAAGKINITMTFSTKHCPLGEAIKTGVHNALSIPFPGYEVEIEVVWEPEWNFAMLTPDGRAMLGLSPEK